MTVLCQIWILNLVAWSLLLCWFNGGSRLCCSSPWFLLKVRYVRILDAFMCSGAFIWLFSPAWDTVKLTLKVGFICPFVVDDPTYLGTTIMVAQALCLSIFNLSPTQKTCLFTNDNKADVSVCLIQVLVFLSSFHVFWFFTFFPDNLYYESLSSHTRECEKKNEGIGCGCRIRMKVKKKK